MSNLISVPDDLTQPQYASLGIMAAYDPVEEVSGLTTTGIADPNFNLVVNTLSPLKGRLFTASVVMGTTDGGLDISGKLTLRSADNLFVSEQDIVVTDTEQTFSVIGDVGYFIESAELVIDVTLLLPNGESARTLSVKTVSIDETVFDGVYPAVDGYIDSGPLTSVPAFAPDGTNINDILFIQDSVTVGQDTFLTSISSDGVISVNGEVPSGTALTAFIMDASDGYVRGPSGNISLGEIIEPSGDFDVSLVVGLSQVGTTAAVANPNSVIFSSTEMPDLSIDDNTILYYPSDVGGALVSPILQSDLATGEFEVIGSEDITVTFYIHDVTNDLWFVRELTTNGVGLVVDIDPLLNVSINDSVFVIGSVMTSIGDELVPVDCELSVDSGVSWSANTVTAIDNITLVRVPVVTSSSYETLYEVTASINGVSFTASAYTAGRSTNVTITPPSVIPMTSLTNGSWTTLTQVIPDVSGFFGATAVAGVTTYVDILSEIISETDDLFIQSIVNITGGSITSVAEGKLLSVKRLTPGNVTADIILENQLGDTFTVTQYTVEVI